MEFPRVVYAIKHEPTGKIYVGSTSKLYQRLSVHFIALRGGYHSNDAMQTDCNEHGFSYSVFILDSVLSLQDKNKEFLWIDALGTRNPRLGYNAGDKSKTAASLLCNGDLYSADDVCSIPAIEKRFAKNKELRKLAHGWERAS